MITLPCLDPNCGGRAEVPLEDHETALCHVCKRPRPVRWVYGKGRPGTKSYQNPFDVWRSSLIKTGRVARSAERG